MILKFNFSCQKSQVILEAWIALTQLTYKNKKENLEYPSNIVCISVPLNTLYLLCKY